MVKAVVLGAAGERDRIGSPFLRLLTDQTGGIGQPLALLLKANPLITEVHSRGQSIYVVS